MTTEIQIRAIRDQYGVVVDGLPVDGKPLMAALCAMRQAWRRDREVFSVEVMQAFGDVIRETEAIIDFEAES